MVLKYYDDEQQITIILTNIDLGVVDHLVVLAYIESCCWDTYNVFVADVHYPINPKWFWEFHYVFQHPPVGAQITFKTWPDDVDDNNK